MTTSDPRGVPGDRPLAVVTGASSGIGLELAKQFAEHDFDVVVAAEDPGIETAADVLRAFGSQVTARPGRPVDVRGLRAARRAGPRGGRPVEALALNAGVGSGGPFDETDLRKELDVIAVNVTSTVHLAKRIIPDMVERGSGKVLITSSIAATQPGPYEAVYAATKAFDQSFAESIRSELKDSGVTVTSLHAGRDADELLPPGRDGRHPGRVGRVDAGRPRQGRRAGLRGPHEGRGEGRRRATRRTRCMAAAGRVTPDSVKAATHKLLSKPGSGE